MESFFADINFFDVAVFLIIIISCIVAFFRGLIKSFFSTFVWLGSVLFTIAFKAKVKSFLVNYIEHDSVAGFVAVTLTFLVIFIILASIAHKLMKKLDNYRKGAIDRSFGVLMGLFRGVLTVSVIFYVVNSVYALSKQETPEFLTQAKSYNTLKVVSGTIFSFVPEKVIHSFNDKMKNTYKTVSESVNNNIYDNIKNSKNFKDFSEEETKALTKLINSLPKKDVEKLNEKYQDGENISNDNQRFDVISDMLEIYKKSAAEGEIRQSNLLNTQEIKLLEKAIKYRSFDIESLLGGKDKDGTGYKKDNRIQLDRLINNLL